MSLKTRIPRHPARWGITAQDYDTNRYTHKKSRPAISYLKHQEIPRLRQYTDFTQALIIGIPRHLQYGQTVWAQPNEYFAQKSGSSMVVCLPPLSRLFGKIQPPTPLSSERSGFPHHPVSRGHCERKFWYQLHGTLSVHHSVWTPPFIIRRGVRG